VPVYPIHNIKKNALELLKRIPPIYPYHSVEHTLYVLETSLKIANYYSLSDLDIELIQIAALYHDTGYFEGPKDHEEKSCILVEQELSKYNTEASHLELIKEMIMSTKIHKQPKSHMECILADADLEYIGTKSFWKTGLKLLEEIKFSNPDFNLDDWNKLQLKFLSTHSFHTSYCKRYKQKTKEKHIRSLKALLQS